MLAPMSLYDQDTFAWAMGQADAARRRSANEIDWDNVAEELESLGKQQKAELRSRYIVLITHLLKWIAQPERRGRSWTLSIAVQRREIQRHLAANPSLAHSHDDLFADAYETARLEAARQTGKSVARFPPEPPFNAEQARDPEWMPPDPA